MTAAIDFDGGAGRGSVAPVERAAAIRRARRHSRLVAMLKVVLPISAIAMLSSYGFTVQRSFKLGSGAVSWGPVSLSTENLTMENPRYQGFNKDGSRYLLTAKSAVQDIRQTGPITLNTVEGTFEQANQAPTILRSPRGSFDNKANVLDLFDNIDIRSESGLTARLTRATVFIKDNKVVSAEPVTVTLPSGEVRGMEMVLLHKPREVTFSSGVTARLKPGPRPERPKTASSVPRLLGASDAPVDITSQSLRIDDLAKVAVFTGNVHARQGEATLVTRELEAYYEGSAAAASAPATTGKLKRLAARSEIVLTQGADRATSSAAEFNAEKETAVLIGNVVMTSGADRQATSDRADLDARADTALLVGNTVVMQGRNVLKGRRLFVDRKAGTSQLTSPAEGGLAAGRISAQFHQANNAETGARKTASKPTRDGEGWVFRTDPNAPIDIEAEVLDLNDHARTAVFRGDVHAVQGEFTIRTAEMTAIYTGQAGLSLGQAASESGKPPAQLQKVLARKKVVVTSKDQQSATGDWADFDVKANTVTIGGDVVLTQARNAVRGPKLVIDMTTGQSRMETAAAARAAPSQPTGAAAGGAPAAASTPSGAANSSEPRACGGRMCAVFYPEDAKNAAKRKLDAADVNPDKQLKAERAVPKVNPATDPAGATSSWEARTVPERERPGQ